MEALQSTKHPEPFTSPELSSSAGSSAAPEIEYRAQLEENIQIGIKKKVETLENSVPDLIREQGWEDDDAYAAEKFFLAMEEDYGMKRLFVCCDGTWMNSSGTVNPLSNVARLARSVDRYGIYTRSSTRAIPQIVYYSDGVGSQSVLPLGLDTVWSGATGKGIRDDILGAYCFLCNNFNFASKKDQIILVGFSRGAFTVRCLADFISQIGLLRRKNLPFLNSLFLEWSQEKDKSQREKFKERIESLNASKKKKFSYFAKIDVLAEWDTVSALKSSDFSFVQYTVPAVVKNAFFALSLDEKRFSFQPMPWKLATENQEVKQCAFAGCHGDIGGGNEDAGLSTVSLLWMVAKIEAACEAAFDPEALLQTMLPRPSTSYNLSSREVSKPLCMNLTMSEGKYYESLSGNWAASFYATFGTLHKGRGTKFVEPYARCAPQSKPQIEGGETDQGAVKRERGREKGEEGKKVKEKECELNIHFTVRLMQPMQPSSIRPGKTIRLLQKIRNTWPLASFEPLSKGNGKWVWEGKPNKYLEEDAVEGIELNYWEHWKKEVTKWGEAQGDDLDEDVEFWTKVCDGLNYSLSPPNAQAGKHALVSRIFRLDSDNENPCLTQPRADQSSNQDSS